MKTGLSIKLKICNLPYLIGTFHPAKFERNLWDDVSQHACVLQKKTHKPSCLLTLCGGCSHARDIAEGKKHELQEQHFVRDQGLDLHLKNFQNDSAKNKMTLWRMHIWKSTLRVHWSIHNHLKALLLLHVYCWLCQRLGKTLPDNILKLKDLFLLGSFYMLKVIYLIHFIVPFSSIILMTISIFSNTRVFAVSCIKYMLSTHGAHP